MSLLISIITPTFNHERFIKECIESVLSQTYKSWEMIIVDDCSSDRTLEIISEYSRKEPRIKIISHEENWGMYRLSETYNQALSCLKGDLVAILEGDDFWPKDKLQKQIEHFNDPEVILSYGNYITVTPNKEIISRRPLTPSYYFSFYDDFKGFMYQPMLFVCFIMAVTVIMRKDYLKKIGGFKNTSSFPWIDYPTFLELAFQGKFFGSKEILGFYRKHANALLLNNIVEATLKHQEVAFKLLDKEGERFFSISEITNIRRKMNLSFKRSLMYGYWIQGRLAFIRQGREQAKVAFLKGMGIPNGVQYCHPAIINELLKLLLGVTASALNINLEKITNTIRLRKFSIVDGSSGKDQGTR